MAHKKKSKVYVVWKGKRPGIYATWADCELQIKGVKGAQYKSFDTKQEAELAFKGKYADFVSKKPRGAASKSRKGAYAGSPGAGPNLRESGARSGGASSKSGGPAIGLGAGYSPDDLRDIWNTPKGPVVPSLAVDAACSGNPGTVEYRGVLVETGKEVFRKKPMKEGTNNIGEFLGLVHGLAYLEKTGQSLPIYTDSKTALAWIRKRAVKTTIKQTKANEELWQLIARAEQYIKTKGVQQTLLKWDTDNWGEIPADFGRK